MDREDIIKNLLPIADKYVDLPNKEMYSYLMESFKHAGNGVAGTFFRSAESSTNYGGTDVTDTINHLASLMMCNIIRTV